MAWVCARHCKFQKRHTWLTIASDKVHQLLAHGWWFFPGTPVSSTTKTGRHDISWNIAESGVKTPKFKIKSNHTNLKLMKITGNAVYLYMIPWKYCENIFIRWHQFLGFLTNALIIGFLKNLGFQTLQATVNGKIVFH